MSELFGDKRLLTKEYFDDDSALPYGQTREENYGTATAKEVLSGKVVCLFFSAHWCAPCQHFIPMLREIYSELKKRKEQLEIVFLSFDKTEKDMLNYFKNNHGDWLALPFGDAFRDVLAERYSISVIPKLVVIQPDGDVITSKGRKDVQDKGIICMRGWHTALQKPQAEKKDDQNTQERVA